MSEYNTYGHCLIITFYFISSDKCTGHSPPQCAFGAALLSPGAAWGSTWLYPLLTFWRKMRPCVPSEPLAITIAGRILIFLNGRRSILLLGTATRVVASSYRKCLIMHLTFERRSTPPYSMCIAIEQFQTYLSRYYSHSIGIATTLKIRKHRQRSLQKSIE